MSTEESDNNDCVNVQRSFAITRPLQLAIRELHVTASSLRFWAGLGAVVLVLAVAAPFDTAAHFTFSTLLVYWGAIAVGTFFVALATSVAVSSWFTQLGLPALLGSLAGGAVAGFPVTMLVVAFNRVFFAIDPMADHGLGRFFIQCTLITMAIFTIFKLAESGADGRTRHARGSNPGDSSTGNDVSVETINLPEPSLTQTAILRTPLHQRLPSNLGVDIVSLQAQDHYVDVTTAAGHELILMRLVDAEQELQSLPGLRVHRSWWVAESHMKAVKREGNRVLVLLDTGAEVPVSRSRISALRKILAMRGNSGD